MPPALLLFEGIALGLMSSQDVDEMVVETYRSHPEFYDPRDYRIAYEERLVPVLKRVSEDRRLLDAFCGQGREAGIFAKAGFNVTGVDHFQWMIDAAKDFAQESGFDANFVASDFYRFTTEPGFDIVYTSCWMYSTCQGKEQRIRLLNKCSELATPSGLIVVSTVDASVGSSFAAVIRFLLAKLTAMVTLGNTRTEFGERIYRKLFWHHLSETTVRREARSCGLKIVEIVDGSGIEPHFYVLARESSPNAETQG